MMSLRVVTPAAAPVLTLDELRDHANTEADDAQADRVLERLLSAVTSWVAGPNGWLGRSLVATTYELRLDCWPGFVILPRPPFIEVASVHVVGRDGVPALQDPDTYETLLGGDGLTRLGDKGVFAWPHIEGDRDVVRIVYRSGYGESGEDVDPALRHVIAMTVARLYEARGEDVSTTLQADPPIRAMFAPFRVWLPD